MHGALLDDCMEEGNRKEESKARLIRSHSQSRQDEKDYVHLEFEARTLSLPERDCIAAAEYDARHIERAATAQWQLAKLKYDPTSLTTAFGFQLANALTYRNRFIGTAPPFVERQVIDMWKPLKPIKTYRVKQKPWLLDESIWAPRPKTSNSKDYFETNDALRRMVASDWSVSSTHHRLANYIMQTSRRKGDRKSLANEASCAEPEVVAVRDALCRHARCIYSAFEYYGLMSSGGTVSHQELGRLNLFSVKFNAFMKFAYDCKISSDVYPVSHVEAVWVHVNSLDRECERADDFSLRGQLHRHAWLQSLVRIAVQKFLRARDHEHGGMPHGNVADAVERLCHEHLLPNLPLEALHDGNLFRKTFCYVEATDLVLREHEGFLKSLYEKHAAKHSPTHDPKIMTSKEVLNVDGWLSLIEDMGLVELGLISLTTATHVFLFSRIRSCRSYSRADEIRLRNMLFEDFLEGIVRVAAIVALPTAAEIELSGAADAGEFVLELRKLVPPAYSELVHRRTNPWNERPRQRIHKCLGHMMAVVQRMMRSVEDGALSKVAPSALSASGTEQMASVSQRGSPFETVSASSLVSALRASDETIMGALQGVPAFSRLPEHKLRVLLDAMSIAKFEVGEACFHQGDIGDAFYLITTGAAKVFRTPVKDGTDEAEGSQDQVEEEVEAAALDDDAARVEVATLHPTDYFGERALLTDEPRVATIEAAFGPLFAVFITRDKFEEILGEPLSEYLQAKHLPTRAPPASTKKA